MKYKIKRKAFTLVEIMFVIIILSVLSTIAFFYLQDYTMKARDGKTKDYLNKLSNSIEYYYLKNDEYPEPDNQITTSTEKGWKQGDVGQKVISKLQNIEYQKDFINNKNYEYFIDETGDIFKLKTILENGETYVISNDTKKQVYVNEKTGYIFKYNGNRWNKKDPNCKLPDVEVWSSTGKLVQVWAGCNSTIGDGIDWKEDWYSKTAECFDYNGNKLSDEDCLNYDSLMFSNKSAKDYFLELNPSGENEFGDIEFDNIWGKTYKYDKYFTACPSGWKVPDYLDWSKVLQGIGAIETNTVIEKSKSYGIIDSSLMIGRGWGSHSSFKTPEGNLASLLKIPLSGLESEKGRGNYIYLGVSNSKIGETYGYIYMSAKNGSLKNPTIVFDYLSSDNGAIRCIKDI